MIKRAGIYVRVSSEQQADKVSPETQESDARAYCEGKGYQVIDVYRDTEKYRIGRRLVEPSGTRNDRPQFLRLMGDVDSGKLDVIVAWREDRLYRGVNRAMLEISERVAKKLVEVELVKEHYDPTVATVKAWAAGIELEAKRDRLEMGIAGRLAKGKLWCPTPPYGYLYKDGALYIDEGEADLVRNVWKWYGSGLPMREIQSRVIHAGIPQKWAGKRKHVWSWGCIRNILKREGYYTGIFKYTRAGKEYKIPIPTILDIKTYQAVRNRNKLWKRYPAGNYKENALAAGLVYCSVCNLKMGVSSTTNKQGKRYTYYRCQNLSYDVEKPGCARHIPFKKLEDELWKRVWKLISEPGVFENELNKRIELVKGREADASSTIEGLEGQLNDILMEREQVITWARKKIITEDDLEKQLAALDFQQSTIRHDLADNRLLVGNRAERLLELAGLFRNRVVNAARLVNDQPEDEQKAAANFQTKKTIIRAIVTRVEVKEDKSLKIYTVFNFDELGADVLISERLVQ
jgi:site-specific DNA recombinase